MKRVNEFVNNENELEERFKILKESLYYETAHLSSHHQIRESESYKEILENGYDFLPFIVETFIDSGGFAYPLLIKDITGIENFIKNGEMTTSNLKKSISNWWLENRHNYGK
jgi:hypothetical protein